MKNGEQAVTYTEHLAAAQAALEGVEAHANPLCQTAISQAHALVAIGMLLELLVGMEQSAEEERPFQVVRIIGGMGGVAH